MILSFYEKLKLFRINYRIDVVLYSAIISNIGFDVDAIQKLTLFGYLYYLDVDVILCCYANIKASCLREMSSSIMSLEVTKCDKLVRSILSELGILLSKTLGDSFSSLSSISVSFYPQPLIVIKHKVAQPETTSKLGTVPCKNSESSLSHPQTSKLQKSHYYCCVYV